MFKTEELPSKEKVPLVLRNLYRFFPYFITRNNTTWNLECSLEVMGRIILTYGIQLDPLLSKLLQYQAKTWVIFKMLFRYWILFKLKNWHKKENSGIFKGKNMYCTTSSEIQKFENIKLLTPLQIKVKLGLIGYIFIIFFIFVILF